VACRVRIHGGQAGSETGVTWIIKHNTLPGELIVDPFAGTALWGRIAAEMNRNWLGADVEQGGSERIVSTLAPRLCAE
jgi:hypothetical protein